MGRVKTHHMKVDYNLYEGYKISGAPEIVISNGEIIIDSDRFIGQKGRGRYLKRDLFTGNLVWPNREGGEKRRERCEERMSYSVERKAQG